MTTVEERVKHVFQTNEYQLRETLFDEQLLFNIQYSDDQKFFKKMAIFDFELIYVQKDEFRNTGTTTWIVKHFPITVSISSNPIKQPIFLCISNPGASVESFVDAFDGLALQSKAQRKSKCLEIESSLKNQLNWIFSSLNQLHCRKEAVLEFEDECIEEEEKQNVSTPFLQTQKNHIIATFDRLEGYWDVFPVFGFNSAKHDINLIKSYLMPLLANELGIEPTIVRKANQLYLSSLEKFSC